MSDDRWYALQTQARHENRVRTLIQQEIDKQPQADAGEILEVLVPTHEIVEIRRGKRVQVERPMYPGYVLVRMVLNERTKHTIDAMKGVRFVVLGGDRRQEPQPLSTEDINKILGIEEVEESAGGHDIPFKEGQAVEVVQGPFEDFSGTVQEIDREKGKVKVEVSIFGRPTSVELDFTQLRGF